MTSNRRRYPRIQPRGVVAHLWTNEDRTPCQVMDLSIGGALLQTDHAFAPGEPVAIDLVKPGWKKAVSLTARVVARRERGPHHLPTVSVEFTEVALNVDARLHEYLALFGASPGEPTAAPVAQALVDDLDLTLLEPSPPVAQAQPTLLAAPMRQSVPPPPAGRPQMPRPEPALQTSPPAAIGNQDGARVMLQVRGLLMELGEANTRIAHQEAELKRLRDELALARASQPKSGTQ